MFYLMLCFKDPGIALRSAPEKNPIHLGLTDTTVDLRHILQIAVAKN